MDDLACIHGCFKWEKTYFKITNLFRIFACGVVRQLLYPLCGTIFLFHTEKSSCYASINVKPEGGRGALGISEAFDFSEEFWVPTMGPQNLVKSAEICQPWGSNIR